ncbi:MAG: hypothetical protein PWP56_2069 [Acetobacterium sp.]|nr:hypothetical protein [Acetobacterium sp.]
MVEIIVVLVILAVLAAFVMPTMLGFAGHAEESLCSTERTEIVKYFEINARIHPGLTIEEFIEDNYGELDELCPAGGEYYAYSYFEDDQTAVAVVYCSEHTPTADGRLYILSRQIMDNISEMTDTEIQEYLGITNHNFSNDTFRAKIFEENGGTWNELSESIKEKIGLSEDTNYYIQPYITYGDRDVVLFANSKNEAQGNWNTTLIFNHEEGVWYEKIDGDNFLMSDMGDVDDQVTWEELKEQFKDETVWKAVE